MEDWFVIIHNDGDFGYSVLAWTIDPRKWLENNEAHLPRSGTVSIARVVQTLKIEATLTLVPQGVE